ncbi:MAG: lytic transglycosylase domain-containing protein [Sphingobacteriaceae bacterium]
MIKKHSITCSVMLVLIIMSRLFIYSTNKAAVVPSSTFKKNVNAAKLAANTADDLNFADELLPLDDEVVAWKMKHSLNKYDFKKMQDSKLHHRAEKYFQIIEPILKIYGIPEDFKYIPLVESGFENEVSPKGAAGFWQFMPQTARGYGLQVNSKKDERLLIRKSTIAACKYLRDLYGEFNSWTLVAAAYNTGSSKLGKQITVQGEDNYFKMKLNRETGAYVYNLIAMKEIMNNPEDYGYKYRKPEEPIFN